MGKRVNAAWLQPLSTEPRLLVNREAELDDLVRRLEEHREAKIRESHILISGARGVGKSIFTLEAMRRFERAHPEQAVCIRVDGRGLRYRTFLNHLARYLVDAVRPRAEKRRRTDLLLWLDQLSLFANNSQITRGQSDTIMRRYGAEGQVGADLFVKLQSKLLWDETRSLGTTVQSTLTVSDDLLHAAIVETLERLVQEDSPWLVVIFFDDLDQAIFSDQEAESASLFRQVINLRPCVSLVHFRTEALVENVRREALEKIDLPPLGAEVLVDLVRRRLEAAPETVQQQFPAGTDWSPVRKLASVTGNPLVFLTWVHGLLRSQEWPPPANWTTREQITRLVFTVDPLNGVEQDLVQRLVEIVDRCDGGRPSVSVTREDLLRGCSIADPSPPKRGLSEQEVESLIKFQVLLPRHRFQPALGYRIAPVLDLLRPSVLTKL
jgi:hypothetical protein